ncbi:VOC family protein [Streptomyces sp. 4N509B]|uniref:VOC family protein n=1 Tax=Streptomyces sp. 4N509B TaxID=3457413 RepID=UPI003FCEF88D
MRISQKITPCLWFENQAEEAVALYTSLFEDARVLETQHYGEAGPGEPGSVMLVAFQLAGQRFTALNGGPHDPFNDAVSFEVRCETQEEVDRLWERLTADGGRAVQCGWLKDRYGVSWQIVPTRLEELLSGADAATTERVTRALYGMVKIDVRGLEEAARGA